ncbi:MAG: transcription antitermination factor NusB [Solobacterium sp.]|nr:transcription antitermination factor NusB [Solobacterium sp.]
MSRHELREKAMSAVYAYMMLERDPEVLIEDAFGEETEEDQSYFKDIVRTAIANKQRYAGYIDEVIREGWSFERLGMVEKAILLDGCAEFDLKQVEAAVIIDQAVRLAKQYCDKDAYKLINRVLEVI